MSAGEDPYRAALARYEAEGHRALYGTQWGDPRQGRLRNLFDRYVRRRPYPGDLARIARRYVRPYVLPCSTVLEIGPGGGRWTQFLLRARRIVLVEPHETFFAYLERRFGPRFEYYVTTGDELRGVADGSVDFVLSFGTLVHLSPEVVAAYVQETARVLAPQGVATLQYADKSKRKAQRAGAQDDGFSATTAESFERMAAAAGLRVVAHDTTALNHSNVAVLTR